jgi:hypothetical protein
LNHANHWRSIFFKSRQQLGTGLYLYVNPDWNTCECQQRISTIDTGLSEPIHQAHKSGHQQWKMLVMPSTVNVTAREGTVQICMLGLQNKWHIPRSFVLFRYYFLWESLRYFDNACLE